MGGAVSVVHGCSDAVRDPLWVELSVVYPYHFDSVGYGDTLRLGCGMVWVSVKVVKHTPYSRVKAEQEYQNGKRAIRKTAVSIALLGVNLLVDVAEVAAYFVENGLTNASPEVLLALLESGVTEGVGDAPAEILDWVVSSGGLVFIKVPGLHGMDVPGREVTEFDVIYGDIRRGVYAGSHPTFTVVETSHERGAIDCPPRVKPKIWADWNRTRGFRKMQVLTLHDGKA